MRVLLVGDVFGDPGRQAIERLLPVLRERLALDLVVVNGENATHGLGINKRHANALLAAGADAMTLGNHALRQRDVFEVLERDERVVRPANLPRRAPGKGLTFVEGRDGAGGPAVEVAVLNIMGQLYLEVGQSPWEVVDELVERALARTPILLVDMHAEATSEKVAMGHLLAGKASVVVGTHTHVQTSDARILGDHTGYVTDLGMTGPHGDTVIGVRKDIILKKLQSGVGQRFEPGRRGIQLEGLVADIDAATGRCTSVELVREPLDA